MLPLIRSLAPPLLTLFFMMLSSGLFNIFVSIKLEIEGTSPELIGIVIASLHLGVLIGSLQMGRWISKVGHIRALLLLAVVLTGLVLLQSIWMDPWYWSCLRIIGGICSAGVLIVIESWLLMQTPPNMRSSILSVYLAVLYASLALGQLFINVSDPNGFSPYFYTTLFLVLSILPILMKKIEEPKIEESVRLNVKELFRMSPLGFIGGVISGMLTAVVYGLLPVYAREVGMSLSQIGTFMAILIFGGFSLQWPISRWADKGDRRKVLHTISFITAALGFSIAYVEQTWLIFGLGFLFGGFSFTLYPLSMAYACEKVKESQIVAVTGGFVLSYGGGSILGPLLAPISMSYFGSHGVFYFIAIISTLLGVIALKKPSAVAAD